jgi:hypothetical protein
MHAHAVALRFPRAPVKRSPLRPAPGRTQVTTAAHAARYQASLRVFIPSFESFSLSRSRSLLSRWTDAAMPCVAAAVQTSRAAAQTVHKAWLITKPGLKFVAAAAGAGMVTLACINYENAKEETIAERVTDSGPVLNETVVYRKPTQAAPARVEDEGEPGDAAERTVYQRVVQTIHFANPNTIAGNAMSAAASRVSAVMTKIGAFVAFPGKQDEAAPTLKGRKADPAMAHVDAYLWEVYQREPVKKDSSGDFSWKDPAAAKRMKMSVEDYVIGGMDPEFREQLYHAGRAMDAAGIQWSMLSAFRDDYRQSLAKGFKAKTGNSLHGGSRRTGGYGHGQAVDVTNADGDADVVWKWLDAHGGKYGLHRPMPGNDPAHVQSRGDWKKLALSLRETRLKPAAVAANKEPRTANSSKVAKASW